MSIGKGSIIYLEGKEVIILEYFEKLLIRIGLVCITVALVLFLLRRVGLNLGRLPGDIHIKRSNFELWFPITSGLIVSVIITGALWLWRIVRRLF
ncbi:MAG: DUF2905 domain-containing protein [Kosmotogaceae bacterium]